MTTSQGHAGKRDDSRPWGSTGFLQWTIPLSYPGSLIANAAISLHGGSLLLTGQEKKHLIALLPALTDSTFIMDKRFSNPFDR